MNVCRISYSTCTGGPMPMNLLLIVFLIPESMITLQILVL